MEKYINDNYVAKITKNNETNDYSVCFLYNAKNPTHEGTDGDVASRRIYATLRTARRKANAWIDQDTADLHTTSYVK